MSSTRSRARRLAMQGLYEWALSDNTPQDILLQYKQTPQYAKVEAEYFGELMLEIPRHRDALDERLTPHVSRPIAEIDPVELAILRLGVYELVHRPDVPYRVVINEAVELAKTFGAEDGHKFVNGILDKVAQQVRGTETARARS